jgi:hypothetical protein
VGSNNTLISGTILASFAIVSAAVTGVGRKLSPRLTLFVGVGAMNIGVARLGAAPFGVIPNLVQCRGRSGGFTMDWTVLRLQP